MTSSLLNILVVTSIHQHFRHFGNSHPGLKTKTNNPPKISHVMRVCPTHCFYNIYTVPIKHRDFLQKTLSYLK